MNPFPAQSVIGFADGHRLPLVFSLRKRSSPFEGVCLPKYVCHRLVFKLSLTSGSTLCVMIPDWLTHPFALGLYTGLVTALIVRVQLFLARRDLRKSDQTQLSQMKTLTEAFHRLQEELKGAQSESENLRVKIQSLLQTPERQKLRLLEVLNRAEQRLTVSAPGFAPAWQTAKNEATVELEEEERGRSAPKQVLHQLLSSGSSLLNKMKANAMEPAQAAEKAQPRESVSGERQ